LTPRRNLPKIEGVHWNTIEHSTGQYVTPEKRQGDPAMGTGISPNFLKFSTKACGNHLLMNATVVTIVGNKTKAFMHKTWHSPKEPTLAPFIQFLEKRQTSASVSLRSLLGEPE
jgi:hypothetical protein